MYSSLQVSSTRPERAEAPSPGHALGNHGRKPVALKGQKLSNTEQLTKLLPLQGDRLAPMITQGVTLG